MSSFFEKLKKGMGVEISEIELKKTKEKSERKPLKEDEIPAEQAIPRKKKVQKVKVEAGSGDEDKSSSSPTELPVMEAKVKMGTKSPLPVAKARVIKTEAEKVKKPEETTEPEEVEKPEVAEETEKDEEKPEKQKKPEPVSQNFALKKLGGQEGQLAVDVYQTDTELVIQSAIAGIKTEDLDISIESDSVIIRGIREHPLEKGEKNYFYQECYWGPFSRQIILPEETDSSRAEASMKEGILTIRIPKIERKEKRKILVKG